MGSQPDKPQQPKETYTEEQLKLFIELEKVRQETTKYVGDRLYEGFMEFVKTYKEYVVAKATRITIPLYILLAIVFISMAILTTLGKVSGESMVFLAGAVVGYIISLLSEYIGG
jgi:hypothetical protein